MAILLRATSKRPFLCHMGKRRGYAADCAAIYTHVFDIAIVCYVVSLYRGEHMGLNRYHDLHCIRCMATLLRAASTRDMYKNCTGIDESM